MRDIEKISVSLNHSIKKTIAAIQRSGVGIALVVDKNKRLISTITDGDIRRAILYKIPLTSKITQLLKHPTLKHPKPTVLPIGTSYEELLKVMKEKTIRQIPLIDKEGRVVELSVLSELIEEEIVLPMTAVVMAGGRGERLHPLTKTTPKPMLLLDEKPLMERTIAQLRKAGITEVKISTNYRPEMIVNHFGDGNKFGVDINYITENEPLGTAGALGLMETPNNTVLIINGDIVTQVDFRAMYDFHRSHNAVMTVGVRKHDFKIPYGIIETEDVVITDLIEKPVHSFLVNAGIYLLEPVAYQYIPKGRHFDMTELVEFLVKSTHRVISFPIQEYWLDIGQRDDYKKAKVDVRNGRI